MLNWVLPKANPVTRIGYKWFYWKVTLGNVMRESWKRRTPIKNIINEFSLWTARAQSYWRFRETV